MKPSKKNPSDPSLAERQGLDDRELKENAAENQRSREEAAADWEQAASHRKTDTKDTPEGGRKPG